MLLGLSRSESSITSTSNVSGRDTRNMECCDDDEICEGILAGMNLMNKSKAKEQRVQDVQRLCEESVLCSLKL